MTENERLLQKENFFLRRKISKIRIVVDGYFKSKTIIAYDAIKQIDKTLKGE